MADSHPTADAESIANVKPFHFVAKRVHDDSTIGQDAIDIQNEKSDTLGLFQ